MTRGEADMVRESVALIVKGEPLKAWKTLSDLLWAADYEHAREDGYNAAKAEPRQMGRYVDAATHA